MRFPSLVVAVLFGFAPISSRPALAAGGENSANGPAAATLDLSYSLYVGGLPLGQVQLSSRREGKGYTALSRLETVGIVNAFWQAKIDASSSGVILGGDTVKPSLYDSFSENHATKHQHATLTFGADGPKALYSDPAYPSNKHPVKASLQKNTLDPLSAAVFLVNSSAAEKKPCEVTAPVFDGRRRYDVVFNFVRDTDVHMDNGLYSGKAMVCRIQYKQIAGYDQTVIDNNKNFPKIYAWVATVQSRLDPTRRYLVPLRVWADTAFGIVVALANEVKLDGSELSHSGRG
jgi:Protein of unknown function (DUF3108)